MIGPMRGLIVLAVAAGGSISNFFFPVFFVYLPLMFRVIVMSLLLIFFVWVNYRLVGSTSEGARTGPLNFFFGSIWLLPFLTTVLFMPLTKVGGDLIKRADQG
jgi:hypothetical protein